MSGATVKPHAKSRRQTPLNPKNSWQSKRHQKADALHVFGRGEDFMEDQPRIYSNSGLDRARHQEVQQHGRWVLEPKEESDQQKLAPLSPVRRPQYPADARFVSLAAKGGYQPAFVADTRQGTSHRGAARPVAPLSAHAACRKPGSVGCWRHGQEPTGVGIVDRRRCRHQKSLPGRYKQQARPELAVAILPAHGGIAARAPCGSPDRRPRGTGLARRPPAGPMHRFPASSIPARRICLKSPAFAGRRFHVESFP